MFFQLGESGKLQQDIIVRNYKTEDYGDLIQAGYHFSTTLLGISFKLKKKILETLEQLELRLLVAYSLDEKKAVGLVTLKEINRNLWGIWDIFVSPTHRGRRISSLLYQASYDFLRKRGVRKAVGSVEIANMASIRSIERNWDGFLSQRFYKYSGKTPNIRNILQKGLAIRHFSSSDGSSLFKIYKQCTGKDWRSFLEVNTDNFLDRFIQYPCYTGLLKLLVRKEMLIAEKKGLTMGYVLVCAPRPSLRKTPVRLYFFLSNKLSTIEAIAFTSEILKLMLRRGFSNVHLYSINIDEPRSREIVNELSAKFGFTVSQNLVTVKKL